jgi:hypothetical protein
LKSNTLDLKKYLWKKRLILIKDNHPEIDRIKEELKINKNKIQSYKIECIFVKGKASFPITLIGLDGLVKLEEKNLDLERIFKLISAMPLANF